MALTFGAVLGVDKYMNTYRVIVCQMNSNKEWKFNCTMMTEEQVLISLKQNKKWLNIKLENGKIKGSAGSLDRFDGQHKPYVILSQIVNEQDKILGYKIANYDGNVKNIPLKEMLAYGNRITKLGGIPVQNAIFVRAEKDKKEHFKSYPNCPFISETLKQNKNKHSEVKRVNTTKNEKTLTNLEEIYTKEQLVQLKLGKEHGVDIRIYANPALKPNQMTVLRESLEKGINIRPIAHPEYGYYEMRYYADCLENGIGIKQFLSPKYNIGQLSELSLAAELGLDISKMCNPDLSAEEMAERRERLERKIWKDHSVKKDVTWK